MKSKFHHGAVRKDLAWQESRHHWHRHAMDGLEFVCVFFLVWSNESTVFNICHAVETFFEWLIKGTKPMVAVHNQTSQRIKTSKKFHAPVISGMYNRKISRVSMAAFGCRTCLTAEAWLDPSLQGSWRCLVEVLYIGHYVRRIDLIQRKLFSFSRCFQMSQSSIFFLVSLLSPNHHNKHFWDICKIAINSKIASPRLVDAPQERLRMRCGRIWCLWSLIQLHRVFFQSLHVS